MAQYGEGVYGEGVYGVGGEASYGTGDYGTDEYGHPIPIPITKTWIPADASTDASVLDDDKIHLDAEPFNKANKWRPSAGENFLQVSIEGRAIVEGTLSKYVGLSANVAATAVVYADLSATAVKEVATSNTIVGILLDALPSSISFESTKAAFMLRPEQTHESASHSKLSYKPDGKPSRASSAMIKALVYSDGHNQSVSSEITKAAVNIPGARQTFHMHTKESVVSLISHQNVHTHTKAAIDNVLLLPDLRFISSAHLKASESGVSLYSNSSEHIKVINSPVRLYEWYVLQDTPVAYWKLDDHPSSEVILDSSGNGHHGQVVRYSDFVGNYTTVSGTRTVRIPDISSIDNDLVDRSGESEVLGMPSILNGYPSSAGSDAAGLDRETYIPSMEVYPDPEDIDSTDVEWMYPESYTYEGWVYLKSDPLSEYDAFSGKTSIIQTPFTSLSYVVFSYVRVLGDVTQFNTVFYLRLKYRDPYKQYNKDIIVANYTGSALNGTYPTQYFSDVKSHLDQPIHIALTHNGIGDAGTVTRIYYNGEIFWEDIYVKDVEEPLPSELLPLPVEPTTQPTDPAQHEKFLPPRELDYRYPKFVVGPSNGDYTNRTGDGDIFWTDGGTSVVHHGWDRKNYLDSSSDAWWTNPLSSFVYDAVSPGGYWDKNITVAHVAYYDKELSYKDVWDHYAAGTGNWDDLAHRHASQEHIKMLPFEDPNEVVFSAHEKMPILESPSRRNSIEYSKTSVLLRPEELQTSVANAVIALTNNDQSSNHQEHLKLVSSSYEDTRSSQAHGKFLFTVDPDRITYQEHSKTSISGHIKQLFQAHLKIGSYTDDGWYDSAAHTKHPILLQEHGNTSSSYIKASINLKAEDILIGAAHSKFIYNDTSINELASSVVSRVAIKFQAFNTNIHEQIKIAKLDQALGHNIQEHVKSSVNAPGRRMNLQEHAKISDAAPLPLLNATSSIIITLTNARNRSVSNARLVSAVNGVSVTAIGRAHTKTTTFSVVFGRTSSAHYKALASIEGREQTGAAHLKYATPAPDSLGRRRGWGLLL